MPIRAASGRWHRSMDLLRWFSIWKTRNVPEQRDLSLQLVSLMNNVPGAVYRGMPDWTVTVMSANIEKIVGHTSEEFTSGKKLWHEIVHPEDQGMLKPVSYTHLRAHET